MYEGQLFTDRRKERRYVMRGQIFTVLRRPAYKIGKILDISRSGMSFTYLSTKGGRVEPTGGLDLLAEEEGLFVENLSFTPVSDCIAPGIQPFRKITTRRQSVRFEGLSYNDLHSLEAFIEKYSLGYEEAECLVP